MPRRTINCSTDSKRSRHTAETARALALLVLALPGIIALRVPLVINADAHLDSDLAVDGLTLLDATRGHWRWHYPGTPHIGILPVVFSLPQALIWGVNPSTLVSGGVVAYLLTVLAIFALAWRVFGPAVASWSLVPLAFASTGVVWLSGRVTGGHLTAVAWTSITLLLLAEFARRGGWLRALALGLWAGVGLYVDHMTLLALLAIASVLAAVATAHRGAQQAQSLVADLWLSVRGAAPLALALAAALLGYQLQAIGQRLDPHNPYPAQFESILRDDSNQPRDWSVIGALAQDHARLLFYECFPRLISGHKLPGLQTDPTPEAFRGRVAPRDPPQWEPVPIAATVISLAVAIASLWALFLRRTAFAISESSPQTLARRAVVAALAFWVVLYPAAFILNKNIYNSDNYRYLTLLIIPLALGAGLFFQRLAARSPASRALALALAVLFAALMTLDTFRWYRRFGWVDASGLPARSVSTDPALAWLNAHHEVDAIFGNYWDVYRLSILTAGRVEGIPFKNFPDRFGMAARLPGERPRTLLGGRDGVSAFYRRLALRDGGQLIHEDPSFWVIDWPPTTPPDETRP